MYYFLLFGLLFIYHELRILLNPSKVIKLRNDIYEIRELTGEQKNKKSKETISKNMTFLLTNLLYLVWSVIGVFVYSEWYLFLFLIFLSIFSSFIFRQINSLEKITTIYKITETIISILVLTFIFFSYINPDVYHTFIK
jgi:hypothetical protein